jgi:SAM-dependent methyltransferase
VAKVLSAGAGHNLPAERRRALDFGCGVGRLSRALASHFDEVLGLDLSAPMVARARELNADRPACRFEVNDSTALTGLGDGEFDLVLSLITLQHVSEPAAVRAYLSELGRVLAPGGLLAVQLPLRVPRRVRWHPGRVAHALARLAGRTPARLAPWAMHLGGLSQDAAEESLRAGGVRVLEAIADGRAGSDLIPSRLYLATR